LFLEVENLHLIASDAAVVATWIALADKSMDENEFASWIRQNVSQA
jgi:prophage maintenance system killer protein